MYRGDWVLPVTGEPLHRGWVAVDGGRVVGVGRGNREGSVDLGRVAILPGLVNAHTHLELSYLHGRIPPGERFSDWVRALIAVRSQYPNPADPEILASAWAAMQEARASGTMLFGDVSNTLVTVPLLREASAPARVFYEMIGFSAPDPAGLVRQARARLDALGETADIRLSLAPHAPYSVSPPLFGAIRADLDSRPQQVSTVHLGESADEVEFIRYGTGAIRAVLEDRGVWTDEWRSVLPAGTSPFGYLSAIGFLDRSVVVVHGVQFDEEDLTRLAALDVTIASCPRSNRHVGVGRPPLESFYASGVDVAFGTDSLASAPDLNMFAELAEAHAIAPHVPPRRLLESATLVGARALGFERDFGSIEPGKRAALIAVRLPAGVDDVEQYLVSGVEPSDITWLDAD